jgi:hypothetical protein
MIKKDIIEVTFLEKECKEICNAFKRVAFL